MSNVPVTGKEALYTGHIPAYCPIPANASTAPTNDNPPYQSAGFPQAEKYPVITNKSHIAPPHAAVCHAKKPPADFPPTTASIPTATHASPGKPTRPDTTNGNNIPDTPTASADTAKGVASAAFSARQALKNSFLSAFAPALDEIDKAVTALNDAASLAMEYLGLPQSLIAEGLAYVQSLIATPAAFFDALVGLFGGLLGNESGEKVLAAPVPDASFSIASGEGTAPLESILGGSASITTEAGRMIRDTVAQVVVIEAAASTAHAEYATADDALADRDAVVEGLDTIEPAADDAVFLGLAELRRAVVTDLTTRGAELPRVRSVTLPGTVPALVAAYRIHADAGRADEIVSRNRIRHPGRVPGGTPLEVLSE